MRVRVLVERLIGTTHYPAGAIIDLPEAVVKRLEKSGTVQKVIGLEITEPPTLIEETADLGKARKPKK